jgi:hypothetical protein
MSLRRLLEDVRRRRHVDCCLTVVVALVVSVLSFFDAGPAQKVSALVLAVLAIVTFITLTTGEGVENPRLALGDPELLDDLPPELPTRREASHDVYLVGVSLRRTLEASHDAFEASLRRGAHLRVLLTDPDADEAAIDARTLRTRPQVVAMREEIRQSLRILDELRQVPNGRLEVRLTRSALEFGLNFVDVGGSASTLYVQLYGSQQQGEPRPTFVLQRTHGEWYDVYREQAESLWRDARPAPALAPG